MTTWSPSGTVDKDAQAKLPDTDRHGLPTLAQIEAATKLITEGWATAVGVEVK